VHRTQVPGGAADPVGERGAIEIDALPGVDLRLTIERQMSAYLETSTWATVASVGRPLSISRAGAGA
jgi:hypothetical protein